MENEKIKIIVFDAPVKFEGQEYKKVTLDFSKLSGRNLVEASKEARAIGNVFPVAEFCPVTNACVAAKAAGVPVDLILDLPANEFSAVKAVVQAFLLGKAL